jgi:hypothetical protein
VQGVGHGCAEAVMEVELLDQPRHLVLEGLREQRVVVRLAR